MAGSNNDYFRELRLKRQAQRAGSVELGVKSAMPVAEGNRPPINPKKRKEDRGRSSRHHRERSSLGKSPKRGRAAGGSSSTDPKFLDHDLQVAEKVTIKLNPYEQDAYLLAHPSQVHDALMGLCSRTLVLGKRIASDLMK